jgi:hypothetical protein
MARAGSYEPETPTTPEEFLVSGEIGLDPPGIMMSVEEFYAD